MQAMIWFYEEMCNYLIPFRHRLYVVQVGPIELGWKLLYRALITNLLHIANKSYLIIIN